MYFIYLFITHMLFKNHFKLSLLIAGTNISPACYQILQRALDLNRFFGKAKWSENGHETVELTDVSETKQRGYLKHKISEPQIIVKRNKKY
jgi:hypothetical protein